MGRVTIIEHPVITDKLTRIRDKATSAKDFQQIVREIGSLMTYEITKDFPLKEVEIETPICKTIQKKIAQDVVIVPILRAGIGMLEGIRDVLPNAKVGFVGLYRDETTLQPVSYYEKFPANLKDSIVLLVDPMLATGGSAVKAVDILKKHGATRIIYAGLVSVQYGIDVLSKAHPDIDIYTAALDEKLNEVGYIVPGLGDCGDRLFGTK